MRFPGANEHQSESFSFVALILSNPIDPRQEANRGRSRLEIFGSGLTSSGLIHGGSRGRLSWRGSVQYLNVSTMPQMT